MTNKEDKSTKMTLIDLLLIGASAIGASRFFKLTDPLLATTPTVSFMNISLSIYFVEMVVVLPIYIGILLGLRYLIKKLLVK